MFSGYTYAGKGKCLDKKNEVLPWVRNGGLEVVVTGAAWCSAKCDDVRSCVGFRYDGTHCYLSACEEAVMELGAAFNTGLVVDGTGLLEGEVYASTMSKVAAASGSDSIDECF